MIFGVLYLLISMTMIASIKAGNDDDDNDLANLCAVICDKCLLDVDLCVDLDKAISICHSHGFGLLNGGRKLKILFRLLLDYDILVHISKVMLKFC
ncbi:unnamed protein product [Meloidogyne enterolobii]|uniref:Uncharacterized protein n=1 Tax=Meloidogyne enterolobii TaxID=390850 RepID=A0ACB0XUJ9_MELEN